MLSVPRSWPQLTPAWMTTALASSFPGAVVTAVELTDVAAGTNDRARARLRYARGVGPSRVFVKREGRILHRLALTALGAREAEARIAVAGADLPLEHPAFYAAAIDRRRLAAVTVMEDVTVAGGRANAATVALPVAQVRTGLAGLARLHAAYWSRPLPAALRFVRPWRLGPVWAPVSWGSLARGLGRLRAAGAGGLVPARVGPTELERGYRAWAVTAASGPPTLLHGDPHPGNTYARPGDVTGFYDWQLVRTGTWAHDVGYFVASSLTVADRRSSERDLLAEYLDALAAGGVAGAPRFDDAWALYRRTPVYGLGTWLHTLAGGRFQPLDVCLATIERFGAAYADHCAR